MRGTNDSYLLLQSLELPADLRNLTVRQLRPLAAELRGFLQRNVITPPEDPLAGGAGSGVAESLAAHGLSIPLLRLGIPDRFIGHGSRASCLAAARLDAAGLAESIARWWRARNPERRRAAAAG
jgi:1-deoxy-D-xylulose-5-phosphate synthase